MSGSTQATIFTGIPTSWQLPGFYFTYVAADTVNVTALNRVLIIGQVLTSLANTVTLNAPVIAPDIRTVNTTYGANSMLATMYNQFRTDNQTTECWLLPLADSPGSTTATASVGITGTATAPGTVNLYVCGQDVTVAVQTGANASTVASALAAAVGTYASLPVTATANVVANVATVTLTAVHAGATAGDIDVRLNYGGPLNGEYTPTGLAFTFGGVAGTSDPDLATALGNLGTKSFDLICCPYVGATQLGEINTLLSQTSGRWAYSQQLYGVSVGATKNTFANLIALGGANNSQFTSILGVPTSPTPAYLISAAYAATIANFSSANPSTNLDYRPINIKAPAIRDQFTPTELNSLINTGISVLGENDAGQVQILRAITTYQYNTAGEPDQSFQDLETMFCLAYTFRYFAQDFLTKFPDAQVLVDPQIRVPAGQNIFVSAPQLIAEAVSCYTYLATLGITKNITTFQNNAQCQIVGGRANLFLPLDIGAQLRQFCVQFAVSKT